MYSKRNLVKNTILEEFAGPPDTGVYSPSVQVTAFLSQLMLFAEHQNIKSWCNVIYREYSTESTHKRFLFMSWDTSTNTFHGMKFLFHTYWDFLHFNSKIWSEWLWKYIIHPIRDTSNSTSQWKSQYVHTYEIKDLTDSTKFRCQWRYPLLFFGYNQELSTHNNTMWLGY